MLSRSEASRATNDVSSSHDGATLPDKSVLE
jgi:hypothetical protein